MATVELTTHLRRFCGAADATAPGATVGEVLEAYFAALGVESFYPRADIDFVVRDTDQHYHVPLLLSPFGYSTYRGS